MAERETRGEEPIVEPFQPDPYLREGPVRPWAKWAAGIAVVFVVIFVLAVLNAPGPEPQVGGTVQKSAGSSAPAPSATTGSGSK